MDKGYLFELSEAEGRGALAMMSRALGWMALFGLVVVTGVHAVSLVVSQIGLGDGVMGLIRVAGVVLVEVLAAIVAVGFVAHVWRGPQRLIGAGVELVWLLFAALNLVTSFTLESGGVLPGMLVVWLHYGLPLSALVVGALFYVMTRLDPEHKRATEFQAMAEQDRMEQFGAQREVLLSPQMATIRRQQGWLKVIEGLQRQGYTDEQIRFMMGHVPDLDVVLRRPVKKLAEPEAVERETAVGPDVAEPEMVVPDLSDEPFLAENGRVPH